MATNMTKEQLEGLQEALDKAEPIAIGMTMNLISFEFITSQLRILNKDKYKNDNGITLVNNHSSIGNYKALLNMSDGTNKIINLREEK